MAELKQLPKPMREVVLVASQVRRHRDVGEILDIPETRVGYLLASAGAALGEAAERRTERERPVASPRAARLRELEDAPPEWLVEAVGRPPARGKNASASILAWRRAALAIDDYRHDHGWNSPHEGLGPKPTDDLVARRAHERAQQAIERVSASAPAVGQTRSNDDGRPRADGRMTLRSRISSTASRVVVPAAAGSSPVAHPSRSPCKRGIPLEKRTERSSATGSDGVRFPGSYRRDHVRIGGLSPDTIPRRRARALSRVQSPARQEALLGGPRGARGHRGRCRLRVDPVLPLPARP